MTENQDKSPAPPLAVYERQVCQNIPKEANDYYQQKQINQIMESVLTGLTYSRPESPLSYIDQCIKEIRTNRRHEYRTLRWDMFLNTNAQNEGTLRGRLEKTKLGTIGERSVYNRELVPRIVKSAQQSSLTQIARSEDTGRLLSMLKGKQQSVLPPIASVQANLNSLAQGAMKDWQHGPAWENIVFVLGGPGSGKGTQCAQLAAEFNYAHLSAGDLLRAEVQKGNTLGIELDAMMKQGKIVPMETTMRLLKHAMIDVPTSKNGFLIDGFPRQIEQARAFEAQIATCKFVLYFDCPAETLQSRLLKRGETSGRADDNIETIKKRFDTFTTMSYPVIREYANVGKCVKISSIPLPEDVYRCVREYFVTPESRGVAWKNIVFILGGPGCGKGTQCERLSNEFNYTHISCGDLLRAEVATGSDRAQQLEALMKEGKIVPVEITLSLMREAMMKAPAGANGFLIDGFPRQIDQARAFEATIAPCKFVLFFDCPESVLESRLIKRGETSGRADDNLATIKKRFHTFINTSYPVVEAYAKIGKCIKISSIPPPQEVYREVSNHFSIPCKSPSSAGLVKPGINVNLPDARPIVDLKSNTLRASTGLGITRLDYPSIIFVLGGPGSGKGTQCAHLVSDLGYEHISSGDLLRNEVKNKSPIGLQVEDLMREGKMVPLEITIRLLQQAMEEHSYARGFLIDGFPRTMEQAIEFEKSIGKAKFVLFFHASDECLTERLLKRGETSGRADDNLESIKKRLETFKNISMPVIDYFKEDGRVRTVDSQGPVDDITRATIEYFADI